MILLGQMHLLQGNRPFSEMALQQVIVDHQLKTMRLSPYVSYKLTKSLLESIIYMIKKQFILIIIKISQEVESKPFLLLDFTIMAGSACDIICIKSMGSRST